MRYRGRDWLCTLSLTRAISILSTIVLTDIANICCLVRALTTWIFAYIMIFLLVCIRLHI